MTNQQLADALNKATGSNLTEQNVEDWYEGGETYDVTEDVVRKYFGDEMFRAIDSTARLPNVLMARLQGLHTITIGGMTFRNLQDGLK